MDIKKDIMISVNPPYSQMIMDGYKLMEFRKKVLSSLVEDLDHKRLPLPIVYIYETKNKGGVGKIIGECNILNLYKPMYLKESVEGYDLSQLVRERNLMIKVLYLKWCFKKNIKPNMNEGWFSSKKFRQYRTEIGLNVDFNFALILDNIKNYDIPLCLNDFLNTEGKSLIMPPQNMCYVYLNNNSKIFDLDAKEAEKALEKINEKD